MKLLIFSSLISFAILSCGPKANMLSSESSSAKTTGFKVDAGALKVALEGLAKTATGSSTDTASFGLVKVTGTSVKSMLTSYAKESNKHDLSEVKIYTKMDSSKIPEADDSQDVVGLTKNVDAVRFAFDLYEIEDTATQKALRKTALDHLFSLTKAGAFVGVESGSWSACGTTFPGLIVLDPESKIVYSLTPDERGC
jgi:hypothetical protein